MSGDVIALASDHAGFDLKQKIKGALESQHYTVLDLGPEDTTSVDYPDYANAMAKAFEEGKAERGVLICGSGIGISIAANRHRHLRAALCHDSLTARLSRLHNDANVLVMGARVIGEETAKDCLNAFFNTSFEAGRHMRRVEKMS